MTSAETRVGEICCLRMRLTRTTSTGSAQCVKVDLVEDWKSSNCWKSCSWSLAASMTNLPTAPATKRMATERRTSATPAATTSVVTLVILARARWKEQADVASHGSLLTARVFLSLVWMPMANADPVSHFLRADPYNRSHLSPSHHFSITQTARNTTTLLQRSLPWHRRVHTAGFQTPRPLPHPHAYSQ